MADRSWPEKDWDLVRRSFLETWDKDAALLGGGRWYLRWSAIRDPDACKACRGLDGYPVQMRGQIDNLFRAHKCKSADGCRCSLSIVHRKKDAEVDAADAKPSQEGELPTSREPRYPILRRKKRRR